MIRRIGRCQPGDMGQCAKSRRRFLGTRMPTGCHRGSGLQHPGRALRTPAYDHNHPRSDQPPVSPAGWSEMLGSRGSLLASSSARRWTATAWRWVRTRRARRPTTRLGAVSCRDDDAPSSSPVIHTRIDADHELARTRTPTYHDVTSLEYPARPVA